MVQTLEASSNPFGGKVIDPQALPGDAPSFRRRLQCSLDAWRADGVKVAWLELPLAQAGLVPVAVDLGFTYHHASDDYLLLTCTLQEGAYVPPFATHYLGAGGVVLTEDDHLLVVRERHGFRGRPPTLKLPGGALHPGEHLADAVVREVAEETGIRTVFETLVCFRHWHGYRYGKSDVYFVCRLRPLNTEIVMQTEEIQECLWMPVDEFLAAESVSEFNKWIVRAGLRPPGMVLASVEGFPDPGEREFFLASGGSVG